MKYLVTIAGTLCLLAGAIQAQTTVTTQVNTAVTAGLANLNAAYVKVNASITAGDQKILAGWSSWKNGTVALLNTYYNRFKVYTTIDLSTLTSAISSFQSTASSQPMLISGDGQISTVVQQVSQYAQQTVSALNAAAQNISSTTGTRAASCSTTYAPKLTVAPITINRYADCVLAEQARLVNIGVNVSSQYTNMLNSATNYLAVINVCDLPSPASLSSTSTSMSSSIPSYQCMTKYIQGMTTASNTYYADNMRMPQTSLVGFRVTRCAKLVQADIQDQVSQLLNTFTKCVRG